MQFKKREKHPWRSVTFLNCAHGTKSRNASHIKGYNIIYGAKNNFIAEMTFKRSINGKVIYQEFKISHILIKTNRQNTFIELK